MKLQEIYDFLNAWAPLAWQEEYDNAGLQVGSLKKEVKKIALSLDATPEAVGQAIAWEADAIINHHPLLFSAVKSIDFEDFPGEILLPLIQHDIAVLAWHTNLDRAPGGVNDVLAKTLDVKVLGDLIQEEEDMPGMGRYGTILPLLGREFGKKIKKALHAPYILSYGNLDKTVETVGFLGGSGADFISNAAELNLDAYITGDIKYHDTELAFKKDLLLFDVGHYYSEQGILYEVERRLKKKFPQLETKVLTRKDFLTESL